MKARTKRLRAIASHVAKRTQLAGPSDPAQIAALSAAARDPAAAGSGLSSRQAWAYQSRAGTSSATPRPIRRAGVARVSVK